MSGVVCGDSGVTCETSRGKMLGEISGYNERRLAAFQALSLALRVMTVLDTIKYKGNGGIHYLLSM